MPKKLIVELEVPSGSRLPKMKEWLDRLFQPHRMTVVSVEEKPDGSQ